MKHQNLGVGFLAVSDLHHFPLICKETFQIPDFHFCCQTADVVLHGGSMTLPIAKLFDWTPTRLALLSLHVRAVITRHLTAHGPVVVTCPLATVAPAMVRRPLSAEGLAVVTRHQVARGPVVVTTFIALCLPVERPAVFIRRLAGTGPAVLVRHLTVVSGSEW